MTSDAPFVVAISRQLGCGGSYVGRLVARRLRYRYVDRQVLREAAEQLGLAEGEVADREERVSHAWEQIVKVFGTGGPESPYVPPPVRVVFDEELVRVETAILRRIAREHSCVIVGKGGAGLLRDHPRLLRVFLHAPRDVRVRRVMHVYGIADPEEAHAQVRDSDENRKRFHRSLMGTHWSDARGYDLCIDTGTIDLIDAREMIVGLVESLRRSKASLRRPALAAGRGEPPA